MSLFCFLWIPLFEFLWLSLTQGKRRGAGGIWALFLGTLAALIYYFNGPWIKTGGFGFVRWLGAFVDHVGLPVGAPFLVFACFCALHIVSAEEDLTHFVLLWLIPEGIFRALSWSVERDPTRLVLIPLLWTALAVSIPYYLRFAMEGKSRAGAAAIAAIPVHGILAVTVYWAFFTQNQILAYGLLIPAALPPLVILGITSFGILKGDKSKN